MIGGLFRKIFGTKNSRELKRMGKIAAAVNTFEDSMRALSDAALKAKTVEFRERLNGGETLDDLLPEAFAAVREAALRVRDMRHFDVQLVGGVTLHEGRIAEMRTGEGKTLVATLAAYLNALPGGGMHIVTVNDYLARRDSEWMSPIYEALGMSVGVIQSQQDPDSKRAAYRADITYGTNNEFGFDYLRDNMAFTTAEKFQRALTYAIVDEVDSILVDEARTPLIISGPAEQSTDLYVKINTVAPKLTQQEMVESKGPAVLQSGGAEEQEDQGDFFVDEKNRHIELTEKGHQFVEEELGRLGLLEENESLYSAANLGLLHHVHAALKAHFLFKRDVDYMVANGEIVIVDEHTGRAMAGRRWSEGIHQAVEAKEGVSIQNETQTLASTTFQNYFRLYGKLAGMTGTADTEAFEFRQIYGLDVVVIPTHMDMVRDDRNDLVYLSIGEKYDAIVDDIKECIDAGRPVLVGTASIESSEHLSAELDRRKIEHSVLNAKQHEREAEIIAQAGSPGVVTLATNMAGRGTDIVLGGNWEAEIQELGDDTNGNGAERIKLAWQERHQRVIDAGGLHIVGTERHESRRIDNQLRGRAGRQGDPGSSRFYLSMEDNLMRIFASDRMRSIMQSLGLEKGEAIEHRMVSNAIEKAQRKVEGHNFDIRKNLLEFDDVANDQRQVIYQQRNELMESEDISEMIESLRADVVADLVADYVPPQSIEDRWDIEGLERALVVEFDSRQPLHAWLEEDDELNEDTLRDKIHEHIEREYADKDTLWSGQGISMRQVEKQIMLQILDQKWKEHLATMDHLRQGIHLRAYAQKQPKQEYKRESFELFQDLLHVIKSDVVRLLSRIQIESENEVEQAERRRRAEQTRRMSFMHAESAGLGGDKGGADGDAPRPPEPAKPVTFVRAERKVGRNETCPCGSGKKFKHCHGKAA
ncbi:MAG: preprotein translocase subunit SecA [Gammaproteobacteria bacterium]|nr:preprotein translocase subunit SecA [Gammaproteobacteria bacterium]